MSSRYFYIKSKHKSTPTHLYRKIMKNTKTLITSLILCPTLFLVSCSANGGKTETITQTEEVTVTTTILPDKPFGEINPSEHVDQEEQRTARFSAVADIDIKWPKELNYDMVVTSEETDSDETHKQGIPLQINLENKSTQEKTFLIETMVYRDENDNEPITDKKEVIIEPNNEQEIFTTLWVNELLYPTDNVGKDMIKTAVRTTIKEGEKSIDTQTYNYQEQSINIKSS